MRCLPPLVVILLLIGAQVSAVQSTAFERHTDPAGRFSIVLPATWEAVPPREGAASEWAPVSDEAVRVWVRVEQPEPKDDLSPYERIVLERTEALVDDGWSIAGSARLEDDALSGHGVDRGVGLRLAHHDSQAQVVLVILDHESTVYTLGVNLPPSAASDAEISGALSEIVSSFRVLGADGVAEEPGGAGPTGPGPEPTPPGEAPPSPVAPWGPVPELVSIVDAGPGILQGRSARYAHDFQEGSLDGWTWRVATDVDEPAVRNGSGLAFSSRAGALFAEGQPAPILVGPELEAPFEAVFELSARGDADASGPVDLLVFDHETRAAVVEAVAGEGGWRVRGLLRRRSPEEASPVLLEGERLWVRVLSDGHRLAMFASADGARWQPVHPGVGSQPFRLNEPRLGVAMPQSAAPSAQVGRVSVVELAGLPPLPAAEGLAFPVERPDEGDASAPILVTASFDDPRPASTLARAELVIEVGDRRLTAGFGRTDPAAPMELIEDPGEAIVYHAVVPSPNGGLTVTVGLDPDAVGESMADMAVYGSAVSSSGLGTGLWRLLRHGVEPVGG
jgi:hypothetical protein